mmetsp:Transcript_34548/g.74932  ORF Transcript_34548/g.74932 Transcript_34548/m.74932 type:complete len:528 (-) Transcript_34548:80-1663(-)
MVFYYTIRGGQCLNDHSHITLSSSDIICYVGRDKHENEYLIQYGWPGDIWFHVDGLSSAHVYFRLKNVDTVSSIPLDDLPPDSVYDMMQICKNNSIAGCKLASCKMVYTPHSNLKKTFDMESGAVTYHDTKRCRYQRCDKDRVRVRELEKTKSDDITIDYYQEMKDNERRIIERKKRTRKVQDGMYDPIRDDIDASKIRATRQGDGQSGLDGGLAALEGLSLAPASVDNKDSDAKESMELEPDEPQWAKEEKTRQGEPSEDVRFLRERGHSAPEATAAWDTTRSRIVALRKLYFEGDEVETPSAGVPDNVTEARREEKEVLVAIFGEDDAATFTDMENEDSLDLVLPVTAYEPPGRYEDPPPLLLEVYVDNGIAPLYPNEPPVLALVGGGLPEARLRQLTDRLRAEAMGRAKEEGGEPQIFNLIAFVAEEAENIIEEETAELEVERKKRRDEERAAKAAAAEKRKESSSSNPAGFTSDAERRAYAKDIVAAGNYVKVEDDGKKKTKNSGKKYDTGVSDQSLINDMFS